MSTQGKSLQTQIVELWNRQTQGSTTTTTVGQAINAAANKSSALDADKFALIDSADSDNLKNITWAQIKTLLDAIYLKLSGGTLTGDLAIPDKILHAGDLDTAVRFPSADTIAFDTSGIERARVIPTGEVGFGKTPTAGVNVDINGLVRASTGLLFGSDTAAANTLDDYEEGSWTPTFDSGYTTTPSFTNAGRYTKIGRLVVLWWSGIVSSVVCNGTQLKISGIPFSSAVGSQCGILGITARVQYQASSNHYWRILSNVLNAEYVATNAGSLSPLLTQSSGTFSPTVTVFIAYITT